VMLLVPREEPVAHGRQDVGVRPGWLHPQPWRGPQMAKGTRGDILADEFHKLLGKHAAMVIEADTQLSWEHVDE